MSHGLPTFDQMRQQLEEFEQQQAAAPKLGYPKPKLTTVSDCDDNPMSPYRVKHSRIAPYEDVVDVIRNKAYKAFYPESYTPIPEYYKQNNIAPPYVPIAGSDYAPGVITIDGMLELVANDQPWALEHPEDMEEIILILRAYIEQVKPYVGTANDANRSISLSIQRCNKLIEILDKGRQRALKRSGKWKRMPVTIQDILHKLGVK